MSSEVGSSKMVATGEPQIRYEQLKESVRMLRAQVRGTLASRSSPKVVNTASKLVFPSAKDQEYANTLSALSDVKGTNWKLVAGNETNNLRESFSMQHLRLQFHIELQEKREEIKNLIAHQRGKSQQIENLKNDHRMQRKKLEARIESQSDKICALEAQLSNRIALNEQELQAQAYAFAAKLRQCEDEKYQQLVAVKSECESTLALVEECHRFKLNQARMAEILSAKRAEAAEANAEVLADKLKDLEEELVDLKSRIRDIEDVSKQKGEEFNAKMIALEDLHEELLTDLKARLATEKDELERVKEDLTKQHALEIQSYKMQKVRQMDCVAERVRAAVESKDASIALLKEKLVKQQEQASALLDIS